VTTGVRERLPSPMALDGVVTVDYAARVFAVRLPDSAGGHAMSLWRQAYAQLVAAERSGGISEIRSCGVVSWGTVRLSTDCLVMVWR
jgi:hypothetical protein